MKQFTLLDGGMGQELIRRSAKPPHPLWSAQILMDEPELVEAVHREFINAGARVITLNSYSATPERLEPQGKRDWFAPLQQRAIELAHRAREKAQRDDAPVQIAGCLPPYFTSYRGDLAPDFEDCLKHYRAITECQAGAVDLFLCETMSSIREGKAAARAAIETGVPTWVSFTLEDNAECRLRSGELLADGLSAVSNIGLDAVLINCSAPETITNAIETLTKTFPKTGAYANGFTSVAPLQPGGTVDVLDARKDLDPAAYAAHALKWIEAGAEIVGGCCEVGPAHIAHLSKTLNERGYAIQSGV